MDGCIRQLSYPGMPAGLLARYPYSWLANGLSKIFLEIFYVFDPDAQPDKGIVKAVLYPFLPGYGSMSHAGRVIDQGFHSAQALGESEETRGGKHLFCGLHAVVFQGKAHHAAKPPHLPACDGVPGMILESAPVDHSYPGMAPEIMGDSGPVEAMAIHPDMQGLKTPKHQKAILRTGYGPAAFLNKIQLLS